MPAAHRLSALALLAALCTPGLARSAQSYDNCTGFIETLPAVVSTQGTWCLRRDLATAITAGTAIEVRVNNVTIDCNGFKLGGLGGGPSSQAIGVGAFDRHNLTVRGCNVRGFRIGIYARGSGELIEDNRVEGSLAWGIHGQGAAGMIRRNVVLTTGGDGTPMPIRAVGGVDVIDNTVDGAASGNPIYPSLGILVSPSSDISVANNRVRNIAGNPDYPSYAIQVSALATASTSLRGNTLGNSLGGGTTIGIFCRNTDDIASDNHLVGFASSLAAQNCSVGPGNVER